jgi:hypothetical protein
MFIVPVLIELRRLDNKPVQLPSTAIFRVRPAIESVEPRAVTVVHYDLDDRDANYDTLASLEDMAKVIQRIAVTLPMVKFTSPSGTPVFLDASKVLGVAQPIKGVHYTGTNAVVRVYTQYQQVAESVSEVAKRVQKAMDASQPTKTADNSFAGRRSRLRA